MKLPKSTGRFAKLGIKRKVQYIFIVAILLCLLVCFIFFYLFMRSRMTETVLERSEENISSIRQNYDSVVGNVNNISKLIMVNDVVTQYLKSDGESPIYSNNARSEIYNMLNSFSGHYSVFVFRNDTSYINTGIGIINADKDVIFQSDWYGYVRSLDGGYTLMPNSNKAFSFNTDMDIVSFARVINDINTQLPLGLLVINIPTSELEHTYDNLVSEDNHFAYIDANGNIICADEGFRELEDKDLYRDNSTIRSSDGAFGEKVVSVSKVSKSDALIVCSSNIRIMEGMSLEILFILSGVLIITMAVMVLINAYINRYITYPISKLADSMQQAERGMLRRVSIQTNPDEIGMLKDRYNEMLVRINRLIDEVIEQEQNRQRAEMNALQEQIKPHFLYNTLDTIGYMSLQNSPDEVYDAIETLGNFYRKFLSKGSQTIALNDEISIVKDYIKLQRLRYDDMFEDEYDIQENLRSVMILKLILQPIVENSIYHGIRPKGEHGIIRIRAFSEGSLLHISVYDSGVGMNEEDIRRLLSGENEKSFGFKGTMDRIKRFYHIEDVVTIKSKEGEYCEIEITVPME